MYHNYDVFEFHSRGTPSEYLHFATMQIGTQKHCNSVFERRNASDLFITNSVICAGSVSYIMVNGINYQANLVLI